MLRRRSNRLKTWRRSHVNRLQIGRQRRVGLRGWPEDGSAHSAPIRRFRSHAPLPIHERQESFQPRL